MTTTLNTATQRDLFTIAHHWRDLTTALTTRSQTWPPAMGLSLLFQRRETEEEAEAATWRAEALRLLERQGEQPGWTAAPLNISVLDAMVTIEAGLLALADQIAEVVQHAPITPAPPRRTWPEDPKARRVAAADDNRRNQLALRQSKDPRRWRYTGQRTAPQAALWLLARVQGVRGPWRPLTEEQQQHIATVARACARLVEHALDVGDERVRLAALCPFCHTATLDMHGGDGTTPIARCDTCGRTWTQ